MSSFEKIFSIFAIIFAIGLLSALVVLPQTRELNILLPLSFAGFTINIIFMFMILRDILSRSFDTQGQKYIWLAIILLFWPAVLYYLPKYGFKPRQRTG